MNNEQAVIDWELGLKLAGNKKELALEMLTLLTKTLADDMSSIKQAYLNKQSEELRQRSHKLFGAVCYCGTPRLKQALAALENALKQSGTEIDPVLLNQCEYESELVIKAVRELS